MNGSIPESLWIDVQAMFLVLPEDGWAKNLIKLVQVDYEWDVDKMNRFVAWVKAPTSGDTYEYMKAQAAIFEKENVS